MQLKFVCHNGAAVDHGANAQERIAQRSGSGQFLGSSGETTPRVSPQKI